MSHLFVMNTCSCIRYGAGIAMICYINICMMVPVVAHLCVHYKPLAFCCNNPYCELAKEEGGGGGGGEQA